ncbi:MFS general substrate transporter [Conidiobolus coronatus NRRL 28638]|uniref:MFS general substrate transporter n=1 Tax=Conidiobolus coronatus (strain ATCC 28846 / CBS 209.66 / NRRL 28638) TaxID=796925 RepID=A0A137P3A0_CONC2|nr:MFS general substrate transporter [Conidiobolus coronatus NRRL 28638]|eukprot:KXN69500.1 MFS general substrate transporter [Conidiobolus coronatus NRRL 28638]
MANDSNEELHNRHSSRISISSVSSNGLFLELEDNPFRQGKADQDQLDNILDKIGMGKFQYILFLLCGFGWLADNMWLQVVILILPRIKKHYSIDEIYVGFPNSALFFGLMLGSLFWGPHSDLHGRRDAFHWTLSIATIAGFLCSFTPNFWLLSVFLIALGFGVGGTVPVDSSIILEFLPSKYHYLVTSLSVFFNLGAVLASFFAYVILPPYSCPELALDGPADTCDVSVSNNGWRYVLIALSILNGLMAIGRVFLFKLPESPQYLLAKNQPEKVVNTLNHISKFNGLSLKFTTDDLMLTRKHSELDEIIEDPDQNILETEMEGLNPDGSSSSSSSRFQMTENHVKTPWLLRVMGFDLNLIYNLFQPYYKLSTILIWAIWILMALSYNLFGILLPEYLEMKGQAKGTGGLSDVYWSYLVFSLCGIPGSLVGGWLVDTRLGRKGTLAISTLLSGFAQIGFIFFESLNLVTLCSSAVSFLVTLMYAVLYSYTPEVFDPRLRSTACGIAATLSRMLAIISPMLAGLLKSIHTWSPLEISTLLLFIIVVLTVMLPIETRGRAKSVNLFHH